MKRTAVIALSLLALSLTGCAAEAAESKPAPTVTVTAEPIIKEVEVIKEVTPQSCIDALDQASEAMHLMSEVQGLMSPALEAAASWDAVALEGHAAQLGTINADLDAMAPALGVAVSGCRSGAQ